MKISELTLKSFLAGVFIAIGGYAYLAIGGLAGAVLFAFGLLSVVTLGTPLYTGTAGFRFKQKKKWWKLPIILIFNVLGCLAMGLMSHASLKDLESVANELVYNRLLTGNVECGILAIGCGIIMTTVVSAKSKYNTFLPLLFGIPAFIICGFPHSIADAFYIFACSPGFLELHWLEILLYWLCVVAGNFIGCNIHNLIGYGFERDI